MGDGQNLSVTPDLIRSIFGFFGKTQRCAERVDVVETFPANSDFQFFEGRYEELYQVCETVASSHRMALVDALYGIRAM